MKKKFDRKHKASSFYTGGVRRVLEAPAQTPGRPDPALHDRRSAASYGEFQVAKLNLKGSFFFFLLGPIIFCELSKNTDTMRWWSESIRELTFLL